MNNKKLLPDYEGHDLTNYNNFLLECLEKDYSGQGTQKHHIFSKKFMGGTDDEDNLIILNYQDHYKAHMELAMCFPKGNVNRGKNYASAKLIVANVRCHLQKRYGSEFDETAKNFWEIAHNEVCELNRGENHAQFGDKYTPERCQEMSDRMKGKMVGELNPFFGRSHTEETKDLIREKRKLQVFTEETIKKMQESNSGEGNGFYGKTHTEETKKLISEAIKNHYKDNPKPKIEIEVPEGIFRCDIIINNQQKNFYRLCPNCEEKVYHLIGETSSDFRKLSENKSKCKKCASRERPQKHLSNRIIIKDNRTDVIYNSQADAMRQLNIRFGELKGLLEIGIFEVVENKSSWDKRRVNKE